MLTILVALNALVSLAAVVLAVLAAADPPKLSGSREASSGERYYARMYAIRSVPVGLASALVPVFWRAPDVALLLVVAATIQAADALLGVAAARRTQIGGASFACAVHLLCAWVAR